MITSFQSPNLQREIIRKKKKKKLFFKFSSIDLLIIFYQQTKFETPSCYSFLRYPTYMIALLALKRGITRQGEIIQTRKKIRVSYYLTRNPYMKFKNPSLNFFERTDERTHARTSRKQYASHFFKVGGIMMLSHYLLLLT